MTLPSNKRVLATKKTYKNLRDIKQIKVSDKTNYKSDKTHTLDKKCNVYDATKN